MPMHESFHKIIVFLGFIFCIPFYGWTGIEPNPGYGARAVGLGNAYVGVWGDFWSLYHNPAGISGLESIQIGAYVERRFSLKELTYGSAGVVFPFATTQAAGLDFSSFGFDAYRENRIGLAYAINVFEVLSIGTKINYANVNILDHGSTGTFFLDIGLNTAITDQISLGFSAYNISRSRILTQASEEAIPTVFTVGIAYNPSNKVLIVADIQKDIDHPVSFRGGIEYEIIPILKARMGVSTEPLTWNAGIGVVVQSLNVDLAFGYHERLGYTPHISLSYGFN